MSRILLLVVLVLVLVLVLVVLVEARLTCIAVGLVQAPGGGHTTDSINKPRSGL